VCFSMGNGDVQIYMFKDNRRDRLTHTLVHEAAHGFLYRYQSSYHIKSWLNEGLAEYLAESLLDNGGSEERVRGARDYVKRRGRLDTFLSAQNIIGEHYGLVVCSPKSGPCVMRVSAGPMGQEILDVEFEKT